MAIPRNGASTKMASKLVYTIGITQAGSFGRSTTAAARPNQSSKRTASPPLNSSVRLVMLDDPRIKRLLKRYPKDEIFSDASVDVAGVGDSHLLRACQRSDIDALVLPIELDEHALSYVATRIYLPYDMQQFDYFLHSYIRAECVESVYADPTLKSYPAPENGPPAKVPLPPGTTWFSVRPQEGQESYEAWPTNESA